MRFLEKKKRKLKYLSKVKQTFKDLLKTEKINKEGKLYFLFGICVIILADEKRKYI